MPFNLTFEQFFALVFVLSFVLLVVVALFIMRKSLSEVVSLARDVLAKSHEQLTNVQDAVATSVPQDVFNNSYKLFDLAETYTNGDVKQLVRLFEHFLKQIDQDPTNDQDEAQA